MDLDWLGVQVARSAGHAVSAPKESPIDTSDVDSGFGALVYISIFISDEDDDGILAESVLDFEAVKQIKK